MSRPTGPAPAEAPPGLRLLLGLTAILLAAFALRWGFAALQPSTRRPDEIYQTLEPAYRMWSGSGVVTWEWREGMRSVLFPGFLAGMMALAQQLDLGRAGYLPLIAGVLAFVSLSSVVVAMWFGWRQSGGPGAILCGVIAGFWPDLVWLGPKTLTEVQAGNVLIIAVGLAAWAAPGDGRARGVAALALIGLLLGTAAVLRPPLAPAVLFVAAWACRRNRRHWVALACGGAIPVAALGLTDAIAWGMPFHSVWRLFSANVIEGAVEEFGSPAVGWYLSKLVSDWGAAFLIVLMLFMRGAPLAPLPAATAGVILVSHAMMGHQEISYIYAALPPILIVAGIGTLRVSGWLADALKPGELDRRQIIGHATVLWALLCGMTAVGGGFRPNWTQNAGFLRAAIELRQQDDLCGLVFYGDLALWTMSGGNSYMDRDAPLYWAMDPRMLAELEGAANFALTERRLLDQMPGYTALGCTAEGTGIGEVCLARTAATRCTATTRHNLNHIPYLGRPWAVPRD